MFPNENTGLLKKEGCDGTRMRGDHPIVKFLILLGILLAYAVWVVHEYGLEHGLLVTLLTWAFFVTATPIADAGFLVDFPVRLLFHLPMRKSELIVWLIAGVSILATLLLNPAVYQLTPLLQLHYSILTHPWPYWLIISLSALGTFLSLTLADEMLDSLEEHHFTRREAVLLIIFTLVLTIILILYHHLLRTLSVTIPL